MLGFSVSQATVSRYMPARSRRPGQSWRTFLRNQAMAFGYREHSGERSSGDAGLQRQSYSGHLRRFWAAQIPTASLGLRRGLAQPQPILRLSRTSPRSVWCNRGVTHCAASMSAASTRALHNRRAAAFLIRSPPQQLPQASLSSRADEVLRKHRGAQCLRS